MITRSGFEQVPWQRLRLRPQHHYDANNWFNNLNGIPIRPFTGITSAYGQRTYL